MYEVAHVLGGIGHESETLVPDEEDSGSKEDTRGRGPRFGCQVAGVNEEQAHPGE